jgi:flagellin
MEQAMERLSSGKRINSAMDDAAGLTIAHSLDGKIAGLNQAVRNANDGIAMVNLAEGAMEEISTMLTRMKELAVQGSNGTLTSNDLPNIGKEYDALREEITRISDTTTFNSTKVIGTASGTVKFQLGDTSTDSITLNLADMASNVLGLNVYATATNGSADYDTPTDALAEIDAAIGTVDTYRASLGAVANRMEHAATNLMSRVEHQSAARSRIEDADYAVESANLAKAQVLQQAGTAMLAQANASTSNVVSLLR